MAFKRGDMALDCYIKDVKLKSMLRALDVYYVHKNILCYWIDVFPLQMSAHTKVRLTLRDKNGMMVVILPVSVKMESKACIGAAKGNGQLLLMMIIT